jgi:GT2 family glycosyltransferase
METKFDIILVSWERLDYLKRTIASLITSGAWNDAERVIIVDNGSLDHEVAVFLTQIKRMNNAFIVMRPRNEGWGKAVNDALGLSRAPYLFICNNDVDFNVVDFHKKMLDIFAQHRGEFDAEKIGILGVWRHTAHGEVKDGYNRNGFIEMDNVPAVGWMMPKSAMEKVGMLPEKGPCFTKGGNGEDTEYVGRMKQYGYLTGVPKTDLATHIDGY